MHSNSTSRDELDILARTGPSGPGWAAKCKANFFSISSWKFGEEFEHLEDLRPFPSHASNKPWKVKTMNVYDRNNKC